MIRLLTVLVGCACIGFGIFQSIAWLIILGILLVLAGVIGFFILEDFDPSDLIS